MAPLGYNDLSNAPDINSLDPGIFQFDIRKVIFKLTLVNGGWGISYEIALRWMPLDLTDDKSTLVQVMAWCRQATSHYLSQCWPRSLSPYGVTRPQWVKTRKFIIVGSFYAFISVQIWCFRKIGDYILHAYCLFYICPSSFHKPR